MSSDSFFLVEYVASMSPLCPMKNCLQGELKRVSSEKKAEILNNGNKQKIISINDLETYITHGWEYVTTLPNGKVIVKV